MSATSGRWASTCSIRSKAVDDRHGPRYADERFFLLPCEQTILVMKSTNALMAASILVFAIAIFGCENEEIERDNSPETLAWRSKDSNWMVRSMVAQNESTPPEVLAEMSRDSDWRVQCHIARNPNTPSIILDGLSRDIDPFVRACVLGNSNVPVGVVRALRSDPHDVVQCWATHSPSDRDDECGSLSR